MRAWARGPPICAPAIAALVKAGDTAVQCGKQRCHAECDAAEDGESSPRRWASDAVTPVVAKVLTVVDAMLAAWAAVPLCAICASDCLVAAQRARMGSTGLRSEAGVRVVAAM